MNDSEIMAKVERIVARWDAARYNASDRLDAALDLTSMIWEHSGALDIKLGEDMIVFNVFGESWSRYLVIPTGLADVLRTALEFRVRSEE